jgi:predicted transcriptional regulator
VIAAAIYVGTQLGSGLTDVASATRIGGGFLSQMFWVNVALVVFNLLPAFPMDGGRVLRALLAMRLDYVRATQIAANIGQAMAILFALWGLFSNPFLLFIALFVWLGASQEASMVQMRSALTGIPVKRAMITDFHRLQANDPLSVAVGHLMAGFQQDFPVLEGDRLVGIMTRDDLAKGLAQIGAEGRVSEVMQREFVTVSPRDMLQSAFAALQNCNCHTLPVVEDGRLLGMMTSENLAEVLMIQEALREAGRRRWSPDGPAARQSPPAPFGSVSKPRV